MRIKVTISGVTALICNRFLIETDNIPNRNPGQERGTPREQSEAKLYLGLDSKPMIPQPNLFRAIVDGGRFHKLGKSTITTAKSSMLYSCLDIPGAEIAIKHKEDWRVDTRAVRIPSTGGRIIAHRPMFDDWELSFELVLDEKLLGAKMLRQIVDDAGQRIGLGDFRPACSVVRDRILGGDSR